MHVGIDAAGDHQQATSIDLLRAGHGPAKLGDPAAGDAHVGPLPMTGRHDHALTDNQVKTLLCHPGILARHQRQCRWPGRFALVAGQRTTAPSRSPPLLAFLIDLMITAIVLDPADRLGSLEPVADIIMRLVARRGRALTWVGTVDVE